MFFSTPGARAAAEKSQRAAATAEDRPHDEYGRALNAQGAPVEPAGDPGYADDMDDVDPDGTHHPMAKHSLGGAVSVGGHGHGGLSRAQLHPQRRPQPVDAGTLTTAHGGNPAGSIAGNPGAVQPQVINYRAATGPTVTFPQPAQHTVPTTPQGGPR